MGSDGLVARCRTYAKDGQRALPSWARASFRDCAHEIERLTAQLAEARENERAAVVAWLRNRDEMGAEYLATWIEAGDHRT